MIGVLVEMIVCRILVPVIVNVVRHVKLMNISSSKIWRQKLNATEISLDVTKTNM